MRNSRKKHGVNADTIGKICDRVKELVNLGAEVAIVVGGGNFYTLIQPIINTLLNIKFICSILS